MTLYQPKYTVLHIFFLKKTLFADLWIIGWIHPKAHSLGPIPDAALTASRSAPNADDEKTSRDCRRQKSSSSLHAGKQNNGGNNKSRSTENNKKKEWG